ncbi:MAG: polysaccharide pyruvyl transferase family protein [Prevotella sp.]|nr:polysaccharide pyruvyl transferase family protein [Prevotella sp.]
MKILTKFKTYLVQNKIFQTYSFKWHLYNVRKLFKIAISIKDGTGLVIIPAAPETVVGSRGDEAMITVAIQNFRERFPKDVIYILVNGNIANENIQKAHLDNNIKVIECSNTIYSVRDVFNQICIIKPAEVVIIGADCMGGVYSPKYSLVLLSLYKLSVCAGIRTSLFGFSYNEHPYKGINKAFRYMNDLTYNIRDPHSLERFSKFTHIKGNLVADAAFLLKPRIDFESYDEIKSWVDNLHIHEQLVIAFNFHPMLRKYNQESERVNDAKSVAKNLVSALKTHSNVNFLLLPHDDRNGIGDMVMLDIINTILLESGFANRILYLRNVPRASHLKAICALMDGVISGRLHLAIASLGSGVPVLVGSYQDKFKGLLRHFKISNDYVLSIEDFCDESFQDKFNQFISNLSDLKIHVRQELPAVMTLAQNNLKAYYQ